MTSCRSNSDAAEQTIKAFLNAVYLEHNWDKAQSLTTTESAAKVNDLRYISAFSESTIVEANQESMVKFDIDKSKTIYKKDTAIYTVAYTDGSELQFLVIQISNIWKLDLNYETENIHSEEINAVNTSLTTMQSFADSIFVQSDTIK